MNPNPNVKIKLSLAVWSLILSVLVDVAEHETRAGLTSRGDRILLACQRISDGLNGNRAVRRRLERVRRERVQTRDDQVQELIALAGGREGSLRSDLFKLILAGFLVAGTGWVIVQFFVLLLGGRNG